MYCILTEPAMYRWTLHAYRGLSPYSASDVQMNPTCRSSIVRTRQVLLTFRHWGFTKKKLRIETLVFQPGETVDIGYDCARDDREKKRKIEYGRWLRTVKHTHTKTKKQTTAKTPNPLKNAINLRKKLIRTSIRNTAIFRPSHRLICCHRRGCGSPTAGDWVRAIFAHWRLVQWNAGSQRPVDC